MAQNEADPRAELSDLTHALAAETRRAERRGRRRAPSHGGTQDALPEQGTPATAGEQPTSRASEAPAPSPVGTEDAPARTAMDVARQAAACGTLDELRAAVARCEACTLHETRKQTVFADGDGSGPGVMFIGEAPGADEDAQGVPFVGRAGKLLTDIIVKGMGLSRETTTIANVLKCRPPENRDPTVEEKRTCTPWLDRQVDIIDPKVLIPLGRHASMHVLEVDTSMGRMRGTVHERRGRKVVATYHPAYLLRSPGQKKECWKDIKLAMQELGLPAQESKGS